MATAPTVPDFAQFNYELGDTAAVITKQNGLNAALANFGNELSVMTQSINADLATIENAYYGALADDPATDPNGNPPDAGDRYFNTTLGVEKSYTGSEWQANEISAHLAESDPHAQYEFRVMHNTTATRAPTATDDSAAGYAPRSTWFDTSQTPPEAYRCINATAGAAVWVKTTLTLDELGSAATEDATAFDPAGSAQSAQEHAIQRSNHTGTQPLSTISDAGTAASRDVTTSATDTTAGRVMKVGDFGVGATAPNQFSDDLDTILYSSCLAVTSSATNKPLSDIGILYTGSYSANGATQTFYSLQSDKAFTRFRLNGNWQPWRLNYNNNNILGTVSQSSGVPTGAIIERGSNANGEYTKFADGTLICSGNGITLTEGTSDSQLSYSATLPHSFSEPPVVNPSLSFALAKWSNASLRRLISYFAASVPTNTSVIIDLYFESGTTVTGETVSDTGYTAIGRWF